MSDESLATTDPLSGPLVALTTINDPETGARLAEGLVRARLAACVNIVPGVVSVYRWEAEIQQEAEWLLVIKTDSSRFAALRAWLEHEHPYEVPELISLPITGGLPAYLAWIRNETLPEA